MNKMGVTISTHNGSAVAREHNIRNPKVVRKEPHIDLNGKFEIWIDEKPSIAYQRLFGKAVEDYNNKQKRTDRKIKDYYQQICNDKKKHTVYEMIVAVGSKENPIDDKTGKAILRQFYEEWTQRNPNLELIGAYYHADEQGVPHIHLDYIPIAHGYKKGLETQTGLVKALGEQGFEKNGKETAQIQWQRRENLYLEELCSSYGIEVDHPCIEGRQHLKTEEYKLQAAVISANLEKQTAEYITKQAVEQAKTAEVLASKAEQKAQEHDNARKLLKSEKKKLQAEVEQLKIELQRLKESINTSEKHLNDLQGNILTTQEVRALPIKKTLTGAIRGISGDYILNLQKTASYVDEMKEREKGFAEWARELREKETELSAKEDKAKIAEEMRKSAEESIAVLEARISALVEKYDIAKELATAERSNPLIKSVMSREQIKRNAEIVHKKVEKEYNDQQIKKPKGRTR